VEVKKPDSDLIYRFKLDDVCQHGVDDGACKECYQEATHPAKTLTDEEISDFTHRMVLCCQVNPNSADINVLGLKFIVEDILKKASENERK
jgi:hypothetical protein